MFVFGSFSFIIILTQSNLGWAATNYCSLDSCSEARTHTLCLYPSSTPAAPCTNYVNASLTETDIAAIVNQHNEWRMKVADGRETRGNPGPQPPATNMRPLQWDDELASIAQRWADQCSSDHDKCRNVERFRVGQNIAVIFGTGQLNPTVVELMQGWYDEVSLFSRSYVPKYRFNAAWGHYSQLVWADTSYVGCGRVRYSANGWTYVRLICNYGPAGNFEGQPVYQ